MKIDETAYSDILNNLHEGLYFVNQDRIITYWNKAAEHISGFTADEVVGRSCADNILTHVDHDGNSLCHGICPLANSIADQTPRDTEIYMHHKDGHRIPVAVHVRALTNAKGEVIGGVELFSDLSNQKANELRVQELEKLALLDNLTQLANRNYIEKELRFRFDEKMRLNVPFGVLFMDIDHFKRFNDTYGHTVGDNVLTFIASTIVSNSRPFDLYGRWGGEEFIGIIRDITLQDLEGLGNKLRLLVESSYIIHDSRKLHITLSIGATLIHDVDTIESLIKRADTLLYKSKTAGRNRLTAG
jgi:diguanylate cyclase (GGDEF)-like protein/PAS domain S-box-containing protein